MHAARACHNYGNIPSVGLRLVMVRLFLPYVHPKSSSQCILLNSALSESMTHN